MKLTIRLLGLAGVLLFGILLIFTSSAPTFVEDVGKDFIKNRIQERTNEKIDSIKFDATNSTLSKIAGSLYQKHQDKIDAAKQQLKSKSYEKLATVIAEMRNLDCECRKKHAHSFKTRIELNIVSHQAALEQLESFMKSTYMEVANELKSDVRIFLGSNLLVFILLLIVSLLKPRAVIHLFLPAVLLTAATLICSFFYIFEQNWILTIIYNDYMGLMYLSYIGVVFLFLCDIVLNRANITTIILNAIFESVGSITISPC